MNDLWRLEDELLDIEARIGLLEACRPLGLAAEEARLQQLLERRSAEPGELLPRVTFARRPSLEREEVLLAHARAACERLAKDAEFSAPLASILAERAEELELEVQLVQARGTPRLLSLARRRFVGAAGEARPRADALAESWLSAGAAADAVHDADQVDLAAELRALSARAGLDIEVIEVDMAARAGVTERALLVRRGERLTRAEAERIFAHEVHGHLLPRRVAKHLGPPFRIGPRGADADEEGRSLHLELDTGLMDGRRQVELGVRHLLAARVIDGGRIGEALLELRRAGATSAALSRAAVRVFRAGGLCREIIYLPGLLRVGPALADPSIEQVFRAGRATVATVPTLRRLLDAQAGQARSATTGV